MKKTSSGTYSVVHRQQFSKRYSRAPLFRHLLNTDTLLNEQFPLSLRKALTFSLYSTHFRRTLVSCPINGFSWKVNLTNVDTSLFTVCSNRPFLSKGKKTMTAFRCPQCYSTSDKMICRRQFQTILASNELHGDRFSLSYVDD